MRIIYLDGPPATGKTTRARQLRDQYPGQVVVMGQLSRWGSIVTEAIRQGVTKVTPNDLIVVIDPDGQPMPPFTFEIEKFEPGAWQQS